MPQFIGAPLDVVCPVCQSRTGQACTQPTDTSRRQVLWYHAARSDAYREAMERGELDE